MTARVVVCGAGAAGTFAAVAAARAGAEVFLLETRERIGGTVAHCLIHTIGGVFDPDGNVLNPGLISEFVDLTKRSGVSRVRRMGRVNVLEMSPENYRLHLEGWIRAERNLHLIPRCRVTSVGMEGDAARYVHFSVCDGGKKSAGILEVDAVVDATGSGAIVEMIDRDFVVRDDHTAAGLILRVDGITPREIAFPKRLGLQRALSSAAVEGLLPRECGHTWVDTGIASSEAYIKLTLSAESLERRRRLLLNVSTFLKTQPGFENAFVIGLGEPGFRDSGRVLGEYVLTEDDVRAGAHFDDAACSCNWPIEYWRPDAGVSLEYLSEDHSYDIPLRSLKVRGLKNVWASGKCLSATAMAQASARIAGACWAMGEAVGRVAVS